MDMPIHLRTNVKNYIFEGLLANSNMFPKDDPGFTATITS